MPKPAYYALCQCVILQLRHFPGLNMDSKSRFILWNVFAQKKITTLLFCHTDILFLLNLRRKIYLFLSMVCLVCFMLSAGSLNSIIPGKLRMKFGQSSSKLEKLHTKKHQVELLFGKVIIWFKLVVLFILCCLCVFCQIMNTNKAGYLNSWKPN